jgi:DNA (cytosine-5)-methyltransferase 1
MKVLSLFDGISAGQLALKRANKDVTHYYASEIDKYAIKVTQHNFPDTIQLGDITKWRDWDIPWGEIDLVMGGSPCQGFSFAGKQLNFDDPRSALFFVFVDICQHVADKNPKMRFLLENVRMKKEYQDVITNVMGVEPVVINSNLVSAQNRHRLYWTNIPNVTQPTDRGILLRDITHDLVDREKSHAIISSIGRTTTREYFQRNQGQMVIDLKKFELTEAGKAYMSRLRNGKPRWEYHANPLYGKASCVTANFYVGIPMGVIKELMRRLTPVECERLQTFPDDYTAVISNTQRYKALGNSWTVEVIKHIFNEGRDS